MYSRVMALARETVSVVRAHPLPAVGAIALGWLLQLAAFPFLVDLMQEGQAGSFWAVGALNATLGLTSGAGIGFLFRRFGLAIVIPFVLSMMLWSLWAIAVVVQPVSLWTLVWMGGQTLILTAMTIFGAMWSIATRSASMA